MNMEIKDKECKECKEPFKPFKTTDDCCSYPCKKEYERKKKEKKDLRTISNDEQNRKMLFKSARIVFNEFIRERDKDKLCICCGKPLGKDFQAGHCFSGFGNANVIFDELNTNGQRKFCNNQEAGNFTQYKKRLREIIGDKEFEELEQRAKKEKKYDSEELQHIIYHYKNQLKAIRNGKG